MRPVYALIDDRTANDPAPTKIPAGALEFDIHKLGKVKKVALDVATAVCTVLWENGVQARFFIPAEGNGGRFRFEICRILFLLNYWLHFIRDVLPSQIISV